MHGVRAIETVRRLQPGAQVDEAFRHLEDPEVATAAETRAPGGRPAAGGAAASGVASANAAWCVSVGVRTTHPDALGAADHVVDHLDRVDVGSDGTDVILRLQP